MAAELIIATEAAADLNQAYAWYEAQVVGRGENFLRFRLRAGRGRG